MKRLWSDDIGGIIAMEWLFIVAILVIGLVTGFKAVQSAILNEFEELAGAVGALSQSYSFAGSAGCCASANGSVYFDVAHEYPVSTCTEAAKSDPVACSD